MVYQNKNLGYLLGVDTGTSKTHALITDISGNALGFGKSGCGNHEIVGVSGLISALNESTSEALKTAHVEKHEIVSMGFGLSGYDWPSEKQVMTQAIESLEIPGPYQFVNDVMIGLIAGASKGWGVAVDAGTGNNVRGRDKFGRIGRITGNSVNLGEFGGAGEMVWRATIAVTHAWTQRGPKTGLTQLLMDFAEVESEDLLIEGLGMDQIHLPPILAMQIFGLAYAGDQVAQDVINFSARELALNVNAVIRQLELQDTDFEVVLIGSIFKAGEIYLKPFWETVQTFAPKANMVQLSFPPVVGSVLLAAETVGLRNKAMRGLLINSIEILLSSLNFSEL